MLLNGFQMQIYYAKDLALEKHYLKYYLCKLEMYTYTCKIGSYL